MAPIEAEIKPNSYNRKGWFAAVDRRWSQPDEAIQRIAIFILQSEKVYKRGEELKGRFGKLQPAYLCNIFQIGSHRSAEKWKYNASVHKQANLDSLTCSDLQAEELKKSLNLNLSKDYTPEQIEAYTTNNVGTTALDKEYIRLLEKLFPVGKLSRGDLKCRHGTRDKP